MKVMPENAAVAKPARTALFTSVMNVPLLFYS
jgi:hypothetical protein